MFLKIAAILVFLIVPACATAPTQSEQAQKTPTINLTLVVHNGHDSSSFTVSLGDGGSKIGDASGDVAGTATSTQAPAVTQTTTASPNVEIPLPGAAALPPGVSGPTRSQRRRGRRSRVFSRDLFRVKPRRE